LTIENAIGLIDIFDISNHH